MADPYRIKLMLRVEKGAELLDRAVPRWYRSINFRNLRMESEVACILGQLFGDYHTGLSELILSDLASVDHGFQLYYDDWSTTPDAFSILRQLWVDEIASRLTADHLR